MTLQQFAKNQIIEFGGLDHFLEHLEDIKLIVPKDKLEFTNEISVYVILIHQVTFDMEKDFIDRNHKVVIGMELFYGIYKQNGSLFAKLLYDIYSYGFSRVEKVRMIS